MSKEVIVCGDFSLRIPTFHINGTDMDAIIESYDKLADSLQLALQDARALECNPRDYYVQSGDRAWPDAQERHAAFSKGLQDMKLTVDGVREKLHEERERRQKK